MNYDRAAIKREVRQAMKQTRPHPMLVTLLFLLIVGIGASLISGLISWGSNLLLPNVSIEITLEDLLAGISNKGPDYILNYFSHIFTPEFFTQLIILSVLASVLISILTTVWNALMNTGYAGYCLDMAQGSNPGFGQIFCGFPRAGSVILAYILVAVFTFLWSMLFAIGLGVLFAIGFGVLSGIAFVIGENDSLAILGVLVMLAAMILYAFALIWTVLRYAMVPYAVIDPRNKLSALDAIRTSKALMKGRKGRYFVLQLSFIGWYLLEYLVVVVGFIIAGLVTFFTVSANMPRIEELLSYLSDYGYEILLLMIATDYYDITWLPGILSQIALIIVPIALLCGAAIFVINLWLTPYRAGSNARFYLLVADRQPSQPDSQSSQPIQPYGGQPIQPYGGQPIQPYGGQPNQPYGGQPIQPYGGQPGQPYGGYAQAGQPPRYGGGAYPQWDALQPPQAPQAPAAPAAPQAPQTPAYPADEPFAPPAAPVAPQPPQAPTYPADEPFAPPAAPEIPASPKTEMDSMPAADHDGPQVPPEAASAAPELPLDTTIVFDIRHKKPMESKDSQHEKPDGPGYPQ